MPWHRAQPSQAHSLVYAGIYLFKKEAVERPQGCRPALLSHSWVTLEKGYTQTASASGLRAGA